METERIDNGLAVRGDLDTATVAQLEVALREAFLETEGDFVLDVSGVTFMDSTGLNELLRARSLLGVEERGLALVCPEGPVCRVLDAVGVTELFTFVGS